MPEKVLKKLNASILPCWKVCFFAAISVGLIAHIYKLTNWLPNWDSLVFRYDPQNMLHVGRWFLPVVCAVSSYYDLPLLNGLIAIIFHGLSAVCVCKIFHVQKRITAILIGAVIVSFPAVTSVLMYNYVADGYSVAFFLSCLAAYFLTAKKPNYLLSAVFIALSAGIYQAYVTVTITLSLFKLIDELIYDQASFRGIMKKTGCILLSGIVGVVLYVVLLILCLTVFSVELIDYQGVRSTASLDSINLHASLYVVKETLLNFFFGLSEGFSLHFVLNIFILLFALLYYIKHIIGNNLHKNLPALLAVAVLGILLALGSTALAFINASVDYHNLMLMGYCVFYLVFLMLYEREPNKEDRFRVAKCWIVLLTAVMLIANQTVTANISYHKAQMAYERSFSTLIRIADRIEQTPGAENCSKILVIGALDNSEAYSVNLAPEITGITDGYIIRADDEIVGQSVLCSALSDYCEKDYEFISGAEKEKLLQIETVQSMEKWPGQNSVTVIDDTVILKLS